MNAVLLPAAEGSRQPEAKVCVERHPDGRRLYVKASEWNREEIRIRIEGVNTLIRCGEQLIEVKLLSSMAKQRA